MVDLNNSQFVLKRSNLQQGHQQADSSEFTWHLYNDHRVGKASSYVSSHSFVVDWQIPESENVEKTHEFLLA
jgi:hypothetical protein